MSRRKKRRWKKQTKRDPLKLIRCVCGDTRAGYEHRDGCPVWALLSHDERSNYVRTLQPLEQNDGEERQQEERRQDSGHS